MYFGDDRPIGHFFFFFGFVRDLTFNGLDTAYPVLGVLSDLQNTSSDLRSRLWIYDFLRSYTRAPYRIVYVFA